MFVKAGAGAANKEHSEYSADNVNKVDNTAEIKHMWHPPESEFKGGHKAEGKDVAADQGDNADYADNTNTSQSQIQSRSRVRATLMQNVNVNSKGKGTGDMSKGDLNNQSVSERGKKFTVISLSAASKSPKSSKSSSGGRNGPDSGPDYKAGERGGRDTGALGAVGEEEEEGDSDYDSDSDGSGYSHQDGYSEDEGGDKKIGELSAHLLGNMVIDDTEERIKRGGARILTEKQEQEKEEKRKFDSAQQFKIKSNTNTNSNGNNSNNNSSGKNNNKHKSRMPTMLRKCKDKVRDCLVGGLIY